MEFDDREYLAEVARYICREFRSAPDRTLEGRKLLACWSVSGSVNVIYLDNLSESVRGIHVANIDEYRSWSGGDPSGCAFLILHAEMLAPHQFRRVLTGAGTPIDWALIGDVGQVPDSVESIWDDSGEIKPAQSRTDIPDSADIAGMFPLNR